MARIGPFFMVAQHNKKTPRNQLKITGSYDEQT
jgi:hypothetical protein